MKIIQLSFLVLLSACSISDKQGLSHLELAKIHLFDLKDRENDQRHIFEVLNIAYAKHHLKKALMPCALTP